MTARSEVLADRPPPPRYAVFRRYGQRRVMVSGIFRSKQQALDYLADLPDRDELEVMVCPPPPPEAA